MELPICGRMREPKQVKHSQLRNILKSNKNILILGKSGEGKSDEVFQYAKEVGKKVVLISLAMEIPETVGGIPYAVTTKDGKIEYFIKLLDERLTPIFEVEGKDYIIFFDEINQGSQEVFNALYSICHPDPEQRQWAGHSLRYAQIIGAGNLSDGSDFTTYLNELPTPLLNRFFICQLASDKTETKNYLKKKWKNIPQVAKYIDLMLDENIPPRDIDLCLEIISYDDSLLLSLKLGDALTAKIFDIKEKVKTGVDPMQALNTYKQGYELLKKNGYVKWAGEKITTTEEYIQIMKGILSEEEIQSIIKGE